MIRGAVNAQREAIVPLRLRGPSGTEIDVNAVVDTGYSGSLTISISAILALGLLRHSFGSAMLADGSLRQFEIYAADVSWDGNWRSVLVSSISDEALLGMRMLAGHELRIVVAAGGCVEITPLP